MSKDRIISLLTDEEIGYLMSGLRLLENKFNNSRDCHTDVFLVKELCDKIDNSQDVGVIGNERM